MKVVYLAILALNLGAVLSLSTRTWNCTRSALKLDCSTTYYDIWWRRTTLVKNFTACVPDQTYYNAGGINCVEGTAKSRILCSTPAQTGTSGCRVYRIVTQPTEVRTYDPTLSCVNPPAANGTAICNCQSRTRIPTDLASKELIYYCASQTRLDLAEATCFTLLPVLDNAKVVCAVNNIHEVEA